MTVAIFKHRLQFNIFLCQFSIFNIKYVLYVNLGSFSAAFFAYTGTELFVVANNAGFFFAFLQLNCETCTHHHGVPIVVCSRLFHSLYIHIWKRKLELSFGEE
jgi:hypothetical protein